jgi:hypothetical protein
MHVHLTFGLDDIPSTNKGFGHGGLGTRYSTMATCLVDHWWWMPLIPFVAQHNVVNKDKNVNLMSFTHFLPHTLYGK